MKPRKSILKRFKITKTGKVLRRAVGQDHLRSKKNGEFRRKNKKWVQLSPADAKKIKQLIQ